MHFGPLISPQPCEVALGICPTPPGHRSQEGPLERGFQPGPLSPQASLWQSQPQCWRARLRLERSASCLKTRAWPTDPELCPFGPVVAGEGVGVSRSKWKWSPTPDPWLSRRGLTLGFPAEASFRWEVCISPPGAAAVKTDLSTSPKSRILSKILAIKSGKQMVTAAMK